MKSQKFKLHACCLPVKGAVRSTICDLQIHTFHFIPNGLYEILTECGNCSVAEVKEMYDNEFDDVIDEYYSFLVKHELGFWCEEEEWALFPAIDLAWERPEVITNAIIDVNENSTHDYPSIIRQLDELACKALQIRCFCFTSHQQLVTMMEACSRSRLRSIELLIKYDGKLQHADLESLCSRYKRISQVLVHSSPFEKSSTVSGLNTQISHKKNIIDSASHCGQVKPGYFTVTLPLFAESQQYNTCLNRKISVCADGEIKNCPSMATGFGNVKDTTLFAAVAHKNFKDLWHLHKDQIEVCKDCEFRHICTDCRAFVQKEHDVFSKPLKCSYDPYTATWPATQASGPQ